MQVRRLARRERSALADEYAHVRARITDYALILASPDRQRDLVGTERGQFLANHASRS